MRMHRDGRGLRNASRGRVRARVGRGPARTVGLKPGADAADGGGPGGRRDGSGDEGREAEVADEGVGLGVEAVGTDEV